MNSVFDVVAWAAMAGGLLWLFVLHWPARRTRQFKLEARIAAPPNRIWKAYCEHQPDADVAPLHSWIAAVMEVGREPPLYEFVVDVSGGFGTHRRVIRVQILQASEGEFLATRTIQLDGKPLPYGADQLETVTLKSRQSMTAVTVRWSGETATLAELMALRRHSETFLRNVRKFCETGAIPAKRAALSTRGSVILSAAAIAAFVAWLGWLAGLILTGALILHEFGHWLAMRLTGQPAPRVTLVPFVGGVTLANHPHKTLLRDAFCALMGPGLSALASLGFLVGVWRLRERLGAAHAFVPDGIEPERLAPFAWFFSLGFIVGLLNLLQLIPVLPLDGGQVLRAVMQSFHAAWARRAMLGLAGLGVIAFAVAGDPLFAGVMALGGLQAWHLSGEPVRARPMSWLGIAAILVCYVLAVAVHLVAMSVASLWLQFTF